MCGIVAGLRGKTDSGISPEDQNHIMRIMTVELLLLTESRGADATGFALLFEDGNLRGMKHGEKATKIVSDFDRKDKTNFMSLMDIWKAYPKPANIVVGHCRKRTIGMATDNNNNHPFKIGDILGVHNGSVENHKKIEENLKELKYKDDRAGLVDSEMIFHLLSHVSKRDKGLLTLDQAEWVVKRLQGKYAVAAVNVNNPYQLMIFRDGKPIEVGISRPTGLIFVASDKAFLEAALFRYNRIRHIYGLDHLPELDLKLGVMPDDHAWVFNMEKDIESNTDVNDLVDARRMPYAAGREKDWQDVNRHSNTGWNDNWKPATPHEANRRRTAASNHVGGSKKKEEPDVITTGRNYSSVNQPDTGQWRAGKKWCDIQRKYIDGEKKSSRQTMFPTSKKAEISEDIPKDLEEDTAEDMELVEKVDFKDHTKYVIPETPGKEQSASVHKKGQKTGGIKEVDAKNIVDGEKESSLNDLAERYCIQHGHFHTIREACKSADIPSATSMVQYDFRIVASRIRKEAMKEGFLGGYNLAADQDKTTAKFTVSQLQRVIARENKKKVRAEHRIVKLKALALYFIQNAPEYKKINASILQDLNKELGPQYSVELEDLLDLFTKWELGHPGFQEALKTIHAKEMAAEAIKKEKATEV
jgi:hypothetical protein